jgi:predicted nucleotidyltransferase
MDRQSIIATLKKHQAELQRQGVKHVALFGSASRGDAGPCSDIDIMIALDPEAHLGMYEYVTSRITLEACSTGQWMSSIARG